MPNYKEYSLRFREIYQLISILLMISMLAWIIPLTLLNATQAQAASLTSASITMSDTDLSSQASSTWRFTTVSTILASHTIKLTFNSNYTTSGNFSASNITIATGSSGGTNQALVASGSCNSSNVFELTTATTNVLTFTHCGANTTQITTGTVFNFYFGQGTNPKFVNPAAQQSMRHYIEVTTHRSDSAEPLTAAYDDVDVTASVSSTFSFGVAGTNATTTCNETSGTTDVVTTSTTIPWGVLTPGSALQACQTLTVATNAANGHRVTMYADSANGGLVSATGADIDNFYVTATGTPIAWSSPSGSVNSERTWGHWGFTSDDSSLTSDITAPTGCGVGGSQDPYGTALYHPFGSTNSPYLVFCHTGPAAANGPGTGTANVGFQIEITALQEPAQDYTAAITYVATPVF